MIPILSRDEDGGLVLRDLAPWFMAVLLELPELLAPEQPEAVTDRLYPDPGEDGELNEDWERLVRPELFALLASAREVVKADLESLTPSEDLPGLWEFAIPAGHVNAWLSALNAARLTLGTRDGVEEGDLDDEALDPDDEKQGAIARIHLLGILQHLLIENESPAPPGFREFYDDDDEDDGGEEE